MRQGSSRCYDFTLGDDGVAFDGRIPMAGSISTRLVSQSAKAVSAREITVTQILDVSVPTARATVTKTLNFKLDTVGSAIVFTRTLRIVHTALDFTPVATETIEYGGNQHRFAPSEVETFQSSQSSQQHYEGGGDVHVPGAR
jgi:hypothetical protein